MKSISIAISTYNHRKFLEKAIDSALGQKTVYPFGIVLLDDASTDGTTVIVESYARQYPEKISAIVHATNRGAVASGLELLGRVTGDYVAMLEGDDYWTHVDKLQIQVDFLEANPDFVLCGHGCLVRNEWTGTEFVKDGPGMDLTLTTRHLIDFHIPTASLVFRNRLITQWPESLLAAGFADRPLAIMLSQLGQVRYLAQPMSVHRLHPGGVWSGNYILDPTKPVLETTPQGYQKLVVYLNALRAYLNHEHDGRIQELIDWVEIEVERQGQRPSSVTKPPGDTSGGA